MLAVVVFWQEHPFLLCHQEGSVFICKWSGIREVGFGKCVWSKVKWNDLHAWKLTFRRVSDKSDTVSPPCPDHTPAYSICWDCSPPARITLACWDDEFANENEKNSQQTYINFTLLRALELQKVLRQARHPFRYHQKGVLVSSVGWGLKQREVVFS